jgi:hypothetical protein
MNDAGNQDSNIDVSKLQIICAVLVLATVGWMAYVIFGTDALGDQQRPVMGTWTIFGAGLGGVALLLKMFIGNMMELSSSNKPDEGEEDLPADQAKMIGIYNKQFVVSQLLLTSAAWLNIDATWASLGAASILVIGMVAGYPTSSAVEKWVAKRKARTA